MKGLIVVIAFSTDLFLFMVNFKVYKPFSMVALTLHDALFYYSLVDVVVMQALRQRNLPSL